MKKTINLLLSGTVVAAVLTMAGCSSNKDTPLPSIDGYNSSDEVGAANLVAHWTFDDNNNEVISGTAPAHTYGTVGSANGQIGKALNLSVGALVFPPIANINTANALNNFSISLWVNVKDTKGAGNAFTTFFGIFPTNDTDIWPNVGVMAETGQHLPSSDTLVLKNYLNTTLDDGSQSGQDNLSQLNTGDGTGAWFLGAKKWIHFVARWNSTTHDFDIFANGVKSGAYTNRGTTPVEVMRVPAQAVFGSLCSSDIGFTEAKPAETNYPLATAMIDDLRVFNTVLTDAEVAALFNLGTAGR